MEGVDRGVVPQPNPIGARAAGFNTVAVIFVLVGGFEETLTVRVLPPRRRSSSSASAERPPSLYKPCVGTPELAAEPLGDIVIWLRLRALSSKRCNIFGGS